MILILIQTQGAINASDFACLTIIFRHKINSCYVTPTEIKNESMKSCESFRLIKRQFRYRNISGQFQRLNKLKIYCICKIRKTNIPFRWRHILIFLR